MLGDIETYTLSELDLRRELAGQQTLKRLRDEHADRFDFANLTFPHIYSEYTGESVAVAECIQGPTLTSFWKKEVTLREGGGTVSDAWLLHVLHRDLPR